MSKPKRIQRRRSKGWRMPPGAVYVGRPTQFGNPLKVLGLSQKEAVEEYRALINQGVCYRGLFVCHDVIRRELRGKDLACWCPLDQPCHADVLLEVANS